MLDEQVIYYILRDNKLCDYFPYDQRYFLTIYKPLLIDLIEKHYWSVDMNVRVAKVETDPIKIYCRRIVDDSGSFVIETPQVQQIAYSKNWYEEVASRMREIMAKV